jgi:hypothetical protein
MTVLNDEDFEAALELVGGRVDEDTEDVAGEAVRITRDVETDYNYDTDVISGTETFYLTRLATGATYMIVGNIVSSYGQWVDTDFGEWERI